MYNRFVCIIFLMFIGNMVVAQKNGAIKGKVVEYRTKQPLTGATIAIPEKDFVASQIAQVFLSFQTCLREPTT